MVSIKQKREALGITQAQLAAYFGVAQSTVVGWERVGSMAPSKVMPGLAQYFKCSIDDLFREEPERTG